MLPFFSHEHETGVIHRELIVQAVVPILKAGLLYFAVVFGVGFMLGTIRTLWVVPHFGTRAAELMEAPIMFVITISAARWIVEGNVLHFELGHGIEPEEAEEVFVYRPLFIKTKKGHCVAFGPTGAGRYLVVIFEKKPKGIVRPMTGWDMNRSEVQYYKKHRR